MNARERCPEILEIIDFTLMAYVDPDTLVRDRLFYAVYTIYFLRIWRTWLLQKKYNANNFITQNAYECLETNLVLLISLIRDGKAENIHELCSQVCEETFRTLRSYSGMESTIVNCTMFGFRSRLHKIDFENKVMYAHSDSIQFPKLLSRKSIVPKNPEILTDAEVESIVQKAIDMAFQKSYLLGMKCKTITLEKFVKKVTLTTLQEPQTVQVEEEDSEENNYLEVSESTECVLDSVSTDISQFSAEFSKDGFLSFKTGEKMSKVHFVNMLQTERAKISKDVTRRFITQPLYSLHKNLISTKSIWVQKKVSKGDFIFLYENKVLYFGCALNFKYLNCKTKTTSIYYGDLIETYSHKKPMGIMMDPISKIRTFKKIDHKDLTKFYDVSNYICHAKADVNLSSPSLQTLLRDILKKKKIAV